MEVHRRAEMRVRVQPFGASLVRHVPYPHGLVVRGREEELAAGMPRQPTHPVVVAGQGYHADTRVDIPDLDRLVPEK